MKILIAAGGTGGHLFPAQQLASQLQGTCEILIAGYKLKDNPFFSKEGYCFQEIASSPLSKGKLFTFLRKTVKGFCQALSLIYRFSPDVVIGFGSYHVFPVLLGACFLRKKIILFEANCVLGKVNRFFLPFSSYVALQFPQKKSLKKQVFVPHLPWVKKSDEVISMEKARAYFGLSVDFPTLLVFGGSQGASFFNEIMPQVAALLPEWQIIHLTGKGSSVYSSKNVCVKEFETQMHLAYRAADLVVCRSGAGTLAELIHYEKPALLIPFPKASDNHQWKNGEYLSHVVKGSRLLAQSLASVDKIASELKDLFQELPQRREALQKGRSLAVMDFMTLIQEGCE